MLDLLVHASQCRSALCQYPNCRKVKGLFRHGIQCKTRASGGCVLCKKMWYLLQLHARACKESECHVPRCRFVDKLFVKFVPFPPFNVLLRLLYHILFWFVQRSKRTLKEATAAVWFTAKSSCDGDDETESCRGCQQCWMTNLYIVIWSFEESPWDKVDP